MLWKKNIAKEEHFEAILANSGDRNGVISESPSNDLIDTLPDLSTEFLDFWPDSSYNEVEESSDKIPNEIAQA